MQASQARGRVVVLGVDLGTSSAKAVAYDERGRALTSSSVEVTIDSPAPGRAEQDPDRLLEAAAVAAGRAARTVRDDGGRVAAIAWSAALHSLLALDAHGRPLTPAVLWADTRAAPQARALRDGPGGGDLARRTGTPVHPMSPLAKLRWFAEQEPAVAEAASAWVSVKEYVLRRLCGAAVVDHSIASASGLFDLEAQDWDALALALARVEHSQLSELVPTTTVLGGLDPGWAERLGVPVGTPMVVGAGDGCLANLGSGAVDPGVAAVTIGTSGAVRTVVDRPRGDPTGRLFCYALTADLWVVGGPVSNGGVVLRWARDRLFPELAEAAAAVEAGPYAAFDALAAGVPPGADGLLFLPYLYGERAPLWEPDLRGVLFGLTARHGREHVLRALLEGVGYQLATVVASLEDLGIEVRQVRATGGFTASPVWLQMVADVLGRPLEVPHGTESSCLGAALLALQALELGDAVDLARRAAAVERTVTPDPAAVEAYRDGLSRFVALRDALRPVFAAGATARPDAEVAAGAAAD